MVQGLTNIPIKNKIADRISHCQSLSDVCKLVKQVKREMENREAFTGISIEAEESEKKSTGDNTTQEEEVIIEVTIEATTTKQATTPEERIIKRVIVVVIAIQVNRQVTT